MELAQARLNFPLSRSNKSFQYRLESQARPSAGILEVVVAKYTGGPMVSWADTGCVRRRSWLHLGGCGCTLPFY